LIFICILISQTFVSYLVLGGVNAYYGIPLPYDFVFKIVAFSPLIYIIGIKILFNLFLGFIASRMAKKEGKGRFTWFIFTSFFGLSAIAILYLTVILEKINRPQAQGST
jgi:hypothetical protein